MLFPGLDIASQLLERVADMLYRNSLRTKQRASNCRKIMRSDGEASVGHGFPVRKLQRDELPLTPLGFVQGIHEDDPLALLAGVQKSFWTFGGRYRRNTGSL
jgi:hypothetical protein